jgi:hypothetical protein
LIAEGGALIGDRPIPPSQDIQARLVEIGLAVAEERNGGHDLGDFRLRGRLDRRDFSGKDLDHELGDLEATSGRLLPYRFVELGKDPGVHGSIAA